MIRFRSTHLCSLMLALAAFTAAPPAAADADSRLRVFGYARALPVETVPDSIIDDWKYLDDRNVLVFRRGQAYLLVLSATCPGLQTAGVIGFNAATSGLVAAKTLMVGSRNTSSECGVAQIVQLERTGSLPSAATAPAPARAAVPPPAPPPPPAAAAPEAAPAPPAAAPEPAPPPPTVPRIEREIKAPPGATPL